MKSDPMTVIAGITIAAFVIERVVSAVLFLLSFQLSWADPASVEGPDHHKAEKRYKMVYFLLAVPLACFVPFYLKLGVFSALGFPSNSGLDALVTILVVVAGSDRIAELMKGRDVSKPAQSVDEPVRVTGTLTILSDDKRS